MKKPKISVIMAVYNSAEYLGECIKGVLNQSFKDFELIMINDCSKDNSLEIMKKYQKKDKRIKIVNNRNNSGPAVTRNNGLNIARGKYIAVQDSDDFSLPNRLEVEYNYLEAHPSVFLVGSAAKVIFSGEKETFPADAIYGIEENKKRLVKNNHVIHSSFMFRNNRKLRYREKFRYSQDYDLLLNVLSKGLNIDSINQKLIYYRINESGISSQKTAIQKFFGEKAQEFYHQRVKFGKDKYDSFNPDQEIKDLKLDSTNKQYAGIKSLIDWVVYADKKKALRLIVTHRKSLDSKYILKKLTLIILPKRIMKMYRDYVGQLLK